jgi:hypothetical protein
MDLNKVIEEFEAKHTCLLADRHAENVQQLCDQMLNELSQEGFYYKDLIEVARVLDLIYKGLSEQRVSNAVSVTVCDLVCSFACSSQPSSRYPHPLPEVPVF